MAIQSVLGAIVWSDLGLNPVALDLGFFQLRWYSLAYLAGIFIGYWYLLKLLKQPGAPNVEHSTCGDCMPSPPR